jgi:hypothetical protein
MPKIDESTVIQFNLKWFLGIIVALLTSFGSFYYTVQKPNNDSIKAHMDELMIKEREYQELKFEKLDELSSKVNDINGKVDALQRRELDELRSQVDDNTGASF